MDTSPYNESVDIEISSGYPIPSEYTKQDGRLMTFEEFRNGPGRDTSPINKDSSWVDKRELLDCPNGEGIEFRPDGTPSGRYWSGTLYFPSKADMMDSLDYTDNGASDGSKRKFDFYITAVLEVPHDDFNPDTGEWDIESRLVTRQYSEVVKEAVWSYKDYDQGRSTEYGVKIDASGSESDRPNFSFMFDIGIDGSWTRERFQDDPVITIYEDVSPSDVPKQTSGRFNVSTVARIDDEQNEGDTEYDDVDVPYRIENRAPILSYSVVDKASSNPNFLYATRPILIKDLSTDPEDDLMDIRYTVSKGGATASEWEFTKDTSASPLKVKTQKVDDFVTSINVDLVTKSNTIVFKEPGIYTLNISIGDVRDSGIVSQNRDSRTITFNVRSAPKVPIADFSYRLNGSEVDYTYPGIAVGLLGTSVDENDDITAWEWTTFDNKKFTTKEGNTTVFPAEGTYKTKLKVTDFTGLTGSVEKSINVLPPMPMAILTSSDTSTLKLNRKVSIIATESFAPPTDVIQWAKTEWTIIPMDGQDIGAIKIDTTASDNSTKYVVFKDKGRYKATIKLYNNFSIANPTHPRISLREKSIILNISDNKLPTPSFTLNGNSPNFKDNPTQTTVKTNNTSKSDDGDLFDTFPAPVNTEDYFGRGVNAFLWQVKKDADEDGVYETSIGNYNGKNVDLVVPFRANEGTNYQAVLTSTETFGQKTIPKFVTDGERKKETLVKSFTIDWIPDVKFVLPTWAYPDDTINVVTTILDEKPDKVKIVWTTYQQEMGGTYVPVSIDSYTEHNLVNSGGPIRFKTSGYYILRATITDIKNQTSYYEVGIRIYPFPTPSLTDRPEFRFDNNDYPISFQAKQNRTYNLLGETSHINDKYGLGIHPIDFSKDYWEIIPMDGQSPDSIKVTNGLLSLTSEATDKFQTSGNSIDRQILFKQPGRYKVRYQITNSIGKKSPIVEQTVQVHEDLKPQIAYDIIERTYRNPADSNNASIIAYNIQISSPDRDIIKNERVRIRFDRNNNGSFDDEAWQLGPAIDKTNPSNWKVEFKRNHVGMYQIEIYADEDYGQPTIARYISK